VKPGDTAPSELATPDAEQALPRHWFLGIPFTPLTLTDAAARIVARPPGSPFAFVSTPNAQHVVAVGHGDRRYSEAHDKAWLVLNDSSIVNLLARRWFGQDLPIAAGSDLTAYLFRGHIKPDDAVTMIGGTAEVERRLCEMFGLRTLSRFDPPMGFYHDKAEIERCVDFILLHPARYVFLAVGAPQSEVVACRLLERGGAGGTGLCIGSSLLFVTGMVRRAPVFFQRLHAEAIYRLLQNPRRHARRVFVDSLPVLWIALMTRLAPAARRSHRRREAV
jgi:N-acetylglucosaminyldiphosphoundecaprenol N-acetyl-beta-D-mannosaminyltransferase